jgi:hypothetical protein
MNLLHRALVPTLLLAFTAAAHGVQEMKVPFNFMWGDSVDRVESSVKDIKATIVERRKVKDRTLLVVEGIPQKMLHRTLFFFKDGYLCEIELQYAKEGWTTKDHARFFDEIRKNIDRKFGAGRMLVREKTRSQDIIQTLIGYQWLQGWMSLRLFLFSAEKDGKALDVVSLHYREI